MDPGSVGALRVLTLNVWGHGGDWPARQAALRTGLAGLAPDLVALQETVVRADHDQVAEILGDGYHVLHGRVRGQGGVGISIASRWPPRRDRELDLAMGRTAGVIPPSLLMVEVDAGAPIGHVTFANYLPSWPPDFEHERQLQAVVAARAVDAFGGRDGHAVVAGDLDADPEAASVRFWTGHAALGGLSVCYRDAWQAANGAERGDTYTPDNPLVSDPEWPFRRIDYVLVRCRPHGGPTLAVRRCERVFDQPVQGTWASDHFGVIADLAVHAPR